MANSSPHNHRFVVGLEDGTGGLSVEGQQAQTEETPSQYVHDIVSGHDGDPVTSASVHAKPRDRHNSYTLGQDTFTFTRTSKHDGEFYYNPVLSASTSAQTLPQHGDSNSPANSRQTTDQDNRYLHYNIVLPNTGDVGRQTGIAFAPRFSNQPQTRVPCTYEGCKSSFSRQADVSRHIKSCHEADFISCPRPKCSRTGNNGFTRRDHLMDHLRGYHGDAYTPARRYLWSDIR